MPATTTFSFVHPSLEGGKSDLVLPVTTTVDTIKALFGDTIGKDASTINLKLSQVVTTSTSGLGSGKQPAVAALSSVTVQVELSPSSPASLGDSSTAPVTGQKRGRSEYSGVTAATPSSSTGPQTRSVGVRHGPAAPAAVQATAEAAVKTVFAAPSGSPAGGSTAASDSILIIQVDFEGQTMNYKVRPGNPIGDIGRHVAAAKKICPKSLALCLDGIRVDWDTAVGDFLVDGDTLQAFLISGGD